MKKAALLLLIVVLTLAAQAAGLSETIKLTLKPAVEVRSGQSVRLKDVATIQAATNTAGKLGEIVIATAPMPGAHRTVNISYVRALVANSGISGQLKLVGSESVKMTGKCVRISSQELGEEAKSFMLEQLPKDGRTYDVTIQRAPREVVLADEGSAELKPRMLSSSVHCGPNTIAIDILQNGRTAATTSAALDVKAVADVLVATTVIAQGEAITASNTTWEQREITRQPQAIMMSECGELQEWISRRSIRQGAIITSNDVALPPAIRQGDTVTLVVKCGSVVLRAAAQAKESGRVGDSIRVLSPASQGDIRARITEPGIVEINR